MTTSFDIRYDDRFNDQLERGEPYADTGVRLFVGDSVIGGTPDRYSVFAFVIPLCRKLCEVIPVLVEGDDAEVSFLATSYSLSFDHVRDDEVMIRSSAGEQSPAVSLVSLGEAFVHASTELLEYVEAVNDDLLNDEQVQGLTHAISAANASLEA
ncbi:hypothetical protein [Haloferax sp. DFSO60]|uniref:hypothetical protein n=1 Tax=Haloferax sp. DFSO60 TaxID=3388652 RepID=UPI003977FA8C